MSAAIPRPLAAMQRSSLTPAMHSSGSSRSASSVGRPTSSWPPASADKPTIVEDPCAGVNGQAKKAKGCQGEDREADRNDVHRRLDDAVEDAQPDIAPGEPIVDAPSKTHH